jgi:hypothetical protein
MPGSTGLGRSHRSTIPAQATAGTVQSTDIAEVPFNGTIIGASLTTPVAVAANATNYRIFTLQNRGAAGTGTTVLATLDTSTTGFVAHDEREMVLSATPADLEVAAGDILAIVETVAAAGVAHSGFLASVAQDRDVNE